MKKRLLPITAVCLLGVLFGITSCGETPTTPSTTPTEPVPTTPTEPELVLNKLEITNKAVFDTADKDYKIFYEGTEGRTLELNLDPVQNLPLLIKNKKLKTESSNPAVADVSGLKVLPKAPGEATITVTCGGKTDSVKVTVAKALPVAEKTVTFQEMVDIIKNTKEEDNKTLYTVSGFAVDVKNDHTSDKYGNFYLAGKVDGKVKKIQVYGCAAKANPFTYDVVAGKNVAVHYANAKDFNAEAAPFHSGEYVTIKCMASAYKGNGQLLSQFVEKPTMPEEGKNQKVTLVNAEDRGTVTFVKSEGLTMGEEVSFKVAAKEGYILKSVLVNGASVKADAEGNYKFYCTFDNKVEVVYGREGYVSSKLTAKDLGVTKTEKDVTEDIADKEVDGVKWAGEKLSLYYKDNESLVINQQGFIKNTTATTGAISEVVFNYADYGHDNENQMKVEFYTELDGTAGETKYVSTVAGTSRYVVKPAEEKYNFVKISYNMENYSAKFANIEVETKEAPKAETGEVAITSETLGLGGSYADGTPEGYKVYQCADFGDGIQMRYSKSKASYFQNTVATAKGIEKVVLTYSDSKTPSNKTGIIEVKFGDSADALTETVTIDTKADTKTYTATPSKTTYKYFGVFHTTVSGTVYWSKVSVQLVK